MWRQRETKDFFFLVPFLKKILPFNPKSSLLPQIKKFFCCIFFSPSRSIRRHQDYVASEAMEFKKFQWILNRPSHFLVETHIFCVCIVGRRLKWKLNQVEVERERQTRIGKIRKWLFFCVEYLHWTGFRKEQDEKK